MLPEQLLPVALLYGAGVVSTFAIQLALPRLRRLTAKQHVREDVPESHLEKAGTPSMGGLPMVLALLVLTPLAALFFKALTLKVWLCLLSIAAFALVGLLDDLHKLTNVKSKGILARYRLGAEFAVAIFVTVVAALTDSSTHAAATWIGSGQWPLWAAIALGVFVIVGGANAVNLSDGLDGLAAGLTATAALGLLLPVAHEGDAGLGALCLVLAGVTLGFLVFNYKPAQVWMGDVGSLGLGAALATVAVMARVELLFAVVGVVFVMEALSVILQVISFKSTGKRIFRMAPIHHHFELLGMNETAVVWMFWIVGIVAAAVGLALFAVAAVL
ncbi:MAG: phospho-N-acetylmuramoyl-pentapeptide-transferase [Armatimonadia bacterium]